MIRASQAEWKKLVRRGMLLGGVGLMVAFTVFAVSVRFLNAVHGDGPPVPQANGPPRFTLGSLETPHGSIESLTGFAANFLNVVALVLCAQSMGSEYGWGPLRVNLSREPRRWVFLGGKMVGASVFLAAATLLVLIVEVGTASLYGALRGVDMSSWWTGDGVLEILGAFLRVTATSVAWGMLGILLAVLFRSAAPAIGIGIGYRLVVENLLVFAWNGGEKWLPGQILVAFNEGGNATVTMARASWLLVAYVALFVGTALLTFQGRDVSA